MNLVIGFNKFYLLLPAYQPKLGHPLLTQVPENILDYSYNLLITHYYPLLLPFTHIILILVIVKFS